MWRFIGLWVSGSHTCQTGSLGLEGVGINKTYVYLSEKSIGVNGWKCVDCKFAVLRMTPEFDIYMFFLTTIARSLSDRRI